VNQSARAEQAALRRIGKEPFNYGGSVRAATMNRSTGASMNRSTGASLQGVHKVEGVQPNTGVYSPPQAIAPTCFQQSHEFYSLLLPGSELVLVPQAGRGSGVVYTRFSGAAEGEYLSVSPQRDQTVVAMSPSAIVSNFKSFRMAGY